MARDLNPLLSTIFTASATVSREVTGFAKSVFKDSAMARAAKGQKVTVPVVKAITAVEVTPQMNMPEPADTEIGAIGVEITNIKAVQVPFTGEETLGLENSGNYDTIMRSSIEQGFRTLANAIEAEIYGQARKATLFVNATGSSPLQDAIPDTAMARRALTDAGAPLVDLQMVTDTLGGAFARSDKNISRANENGSDVTLRSGNLLRINGFAISESGQSVSVEGGTASGATTNATGYDVGATTITLASAGTGTLVAGDVITFAGDDTAYVVATGNDDVSSGGNITLNSGLKKALPASATAITVTQIDGGRTLFFPRSAIVLATRAPALPKGGDDATDRQLVTDPISGITFDVAVYRGYKKAFLEISVAYGVGVVNPEHVGILS